MHYFPEYNLGQSKLTKQLLRACLLKTNVTSFQDETYAKEVPLFARQPEPLQNDDEESVSSGKSGDYIRRNDVYFIPCRNRSSKGVTNYYPPLNLQDFKAFPNKLLKPNAIVDLVMEPGRIINLDSCEADEYKGALIMAKGPTFCVTRTHAIAGHVDIT